MKRITLSHLVHENAGNAGNAGLFCGSGLSGGRVEIKNVFGAKMLSVQLSTNTADTLNCYAKACNQLLTPEDMMKNRQYLHFKT